MKRKVSWPVGVVMSGAALAAAATAADFKSPKIGTEYAAKLTQLPDCFNECGLR